MPLSCWNWKSWISPFSHGFGCGRIEERKNAPVRAGLAGGAGSRRFAILSAIRPAEPGQGAHLLVSTDEWSVATLKAKARMVAAL